MKRLLRLAQKEGRDILRERTIAMALVTQLFVAAFSAFLTVGLVSLYDPSAVQDFPETEVAYVGPGDLLPRLEQAQNLAITEMTLTEAVEAFQRGEISGIVEERYTDPAGPRSVTLMLPEGEVQATLLVNQFKDLLKDYEQELRTDRSDRLDHDVLYVEADTGRGVYVGFAYSVLLPLLVATPIFLSGAITGDSISDEINGRTLLLLRSSPLSTNDIVLGKLLVPVLLAPAQVALWLWLLQVNDLPIQNEGWLLLFTAIAALLLSAASTVLALFVRREGQTQAVYAIFVLVVGTLALLLPQQPLNILARLAVDTADAATFATLGLYGAAALAVLGAALWIGRRQLHADAL